jgi:tripartite-type tricarboxylate transporter receptor subunit TctC
MRSRLPSRRRLLRVAAALPVAAIPWWPGSARAQAAAWPARPIKVVVGFAPGGAVDVVARTLSKPLQAALGQAFVVENRPGAGTNIAMRAVIDSLPDGHTLMLTANSIAANQTLYQPPPYDMARDFTPVALIGRVPVVLAVNAGGPFDTIQGFIAAAKASPKGVNYGSPGNGATPHLAIELFERAAGIQLNHIPYKGGSPALNDLLAGHVQSVAVNALEVQPHVRSGKLRVLAVLSAGRSPIFPEVPTIAESGFPGFEASVWYGLVGPAGLPPAVVARLHAEVQKALAAPEVRDRLVGAGGEVLPGPVERFSALLVGERARYDRLIREARIQPD